MSTQPPTRRDFVAEFVAARKLARHPEATLSERGAHEATARKIATAARRAGVALDVIALDERARVEIYGPGRVIL